MDIEGEVPKELKGAFYRVQPAPQFPRSLGDDIACNGDGMILMFRLCGSWSNAEDISLAAV